MALELAVDGVSFTVGTVIFTATCLSWRVWLYGGLLPRDRSK